MGGGRKLIYENKFNSYDLPEQGPQCNGAAIFDIDALYSPTGTPAGYPYEEKPDTTFEALILDGRDMSDQAIYTDVEDIGEEYSLAGFSTDYDGVDGVRKTDALAIAIPIHFPYVEIFVHLAMANLPESECARDGPFDYGQIDQGHSAELHVALVKKSLTINSIVDWDDLVIIDKCEMIGTTVYDVRDLMSLPFPLRWDRLSCTIGTDRIDDIEGSLIFYFKGKAPYQTFDNLKIVGKLVPF